jgi:hypothetical protein
MSGKTVAKTRSAGEQPVKSGIHRAAKRIGLEPAEHAEATVPDCMVDNSAFLRQAKEESEAVFVRALSSLASGGLYTDDNSPGLEAEPALIHVAGAQLKAVMVAMSLTGQQQSSTFHEGWEVDETFSTHDAVAAMSGIVTMLQTSRPILRRLRSELGGFVSSAERLRGEAGCLDSEEAAE